MHTLNYIRIATIKKDGRNGVLFVHHFGTG